MFRTPTLSEDDLADEDSPAVHMARSMYGSPADVPWFAAPHDGYPFCTTLSSYTKVRRSRPVLSLRDNAGLWVAAMTFGLLEAVTRTRIPESMFLVPGAREGEQVLSGTRLLRFMVNWHHHMHHHYPDHADVETRLEHGRAAARLLHRALRALDEEEWQNASAFFRAGFRTTEVTDMVCAVALTVVPLCAIAHCVWDRVPEMRDVMESTGDKMRQFYTAVLGSSEERMYRAGWCPNAISHEFMSTLWGLPIVSNLSRLPPYLRSTADEHARCVQSACTFYTITDTETYVPHHADPTCECSYVKPAVDEVARLLSEDSIPVVVYEGSRLRVLPAQGRPYVAISHVWADGMGSTTEDGLPTCLVKRIADLAMQLLPESGAFWMDSLCVPNANVSRKRAIMLMAKTYRDAAKVLVIDGCVRVACSLSDSWEENLFRLGTSG